MSVLLYCKNKNEHAYNQMHFILSTILRIEVRIKF